MRKILRSWLFPPVSIAQEITVDGTMFALKSGYTVTCTVNFFRMPVYVPMCRSYVVEYSLNRDGEYEAFRMKENGRVGVRSLLDSRHRFPVCWLPWAFVGKTLDRHILRIDRTRVRIRTGAGILRHAV
ncbi:MAG: hypothetical protein C4529_03165 [Deltaproteobacteria bacterium]|nr:MAG: hypothetical protein C4529_03165 [Deltaproteobacteria bacterium]